MNTLNDPNNSIQRDYIESINESQSQLTKHLEQLCFDLLDLVRFSQLINLLIGVLSCITIPFDVKILLKPMQYQSYRGCRMEETRDKWFEGMNTDESKPTDSICRAWMNVL